MRPHTLAAWNEIRAMVEELKGRAGDLFDIAELVKSQCDDALCSMEEGEPVDLCEWPSSGEVLGCAQDIEQLLDTLGLS